MTNVTKYNLTKGISTILTFGTPITTLFCCGDFIVHRSETAISAAGVFTILILLLFTKDKIAEYFKAPSAAILSFVTLILILLIENIIVPMKTICITTLIATGVDEFTFKRMYTVAQNKLPSIVNNYKHVGFIFAKQQTLLEEAKHE